MGTIWVHVPGKITNKTLEILDGISRYKHRCRSACWCRQNTGQLKRRTFLFCVNTPVAELNGPLLCQDRDRPFRTFLKMRYYVSSLQYSQHAYKLTFSSQTSVINSKVFTKSPMSAETSASPDFLRRNTYPPGLSRDIVVRQQPIMMSLSCRKYIQKYALPPCKYPTTSSSRITSCSQRQWSQSW